MSLSASRSDIFVVALSRIGRPNARPPQHGAKLRRSAAGPHTVGQGPRALRRKQGQAQWPARKTQWPPQSDLAGGAGYRGQSALVGFRDRVAGFRTARRGRLSDRRQEQAVPPVFARSSLLI